MGAGSVGLFLDLSVLSLGEGDDENSEEISISRLDINEALDEGLPLSDHGVELIGSGVHSVEGSLGSVSFDLIKDQLDLSPLQRFLVVNQIGVALFNNSSLDLIGGDLGTSGLGNQGFSE